MPRLHATDYYYSGLFLYRETVFQIDAAKVILRRGDPSVRLQLVVCSTKKDCARCGRWDASFRLLATPSPAVRKACKNGDFVKD